MLLSHGHGRTFVAVPCYGAMSPVTAFTLLRLGDCQVVCLVGNCHVDDARNLLVSAFLDTDCEQLLFIDADTAVEDFGPFLSHDADVVGAAIPKKGDHSGFACNPKSGPIWADESGLIEVHDVGTGVLKIKRHVLQRLYDLSPKYEHEGREVAQIFERDIVNGSRLSGDLNFCRKWREFGKIHIDPEVRVSHAGEKVWQGSYGSYLRRTNGLALTRGIERIRKGQYERSDVIALVDEWGNEAFSAGHEFLAACIEVAQQAEGPIIEMGSGLSSLAMAATGAEVYALEHDPVWFREVCRHRDRLGLSTLLVLFAPLTNYSSGRWYEDVPLPWDRADIVVCDGPPRACSNRNILYEKIGSPRVILHDDITDPGDLDFVKTHDFQVMGSLKPFAVGKWRGQTYKSLQTASG